MYGNLVVDSCYFSRLFNLHFGDVMTTASSSSFAARAFEIFMVSGLATYFAIVAILVSGWAVR